MTTQPSNSPASVKFSVTAALDAFIAKRETPREPDGKWHPSGLFGCDRKAVYEIRGVTPSNPPDSRQRRVFFIGHGLHEMLQGAVNEHPEVERFLAEVPIVDENLNIVGHADGLRFMRDGSVELDEFKSISQRGLEYARKKGDLPKEDHQDQAFTYAESLRRFGSPEAGIEPLGDRLRTVRFTYIGKEDYDTEEIVVDVPADAYHNIATRVLVLEQYARDPASLPPRLPVVKGKKNWRCDWGKGRCAFYDRCWNQDPDEIKPAEDAW